MKLKVFPFYQKLKVMPIAIAASVGLFQGGFCNAPSSDEEAFLIRRIAEFWKDGDYKIVKTQIQDFVQKYPNNGLNHYLLGILGDLYLQENRYADALQAYDSIKDSSVIEKTILNKMQCYYELDKYEDLYKEGEGYLHYTSSDFQERRYEYHFLLAEGYFRTALSLSSESDIDLLVSKAMPFYEELMHTEYGEVSSLALAECYRILKHNAKGAELYLALAEKHASKKENLLFNAGLLQASLDKDSAIDTFDRIIEMNGPKAGDAAYNRLLLFFQTDQFDQVAEHYRDVSLFVPESQQPIYNFIVGKSYYALEEYGFATSPLGKYIESQDRQSDEFKDALLIQMTCAKNTNNERLFDNTLKTFKSFYPEDEEISKAHFMHAMILKVDGKPEKVESELKFILDSFPHFEDQESLLYEYAIVTHQNENFIKSYETLKEFLGRFSQSERAESGWRHFLSCCLHLSKSEETKQLYSKNTFLSDLDQILQSENGLSKEEIKEYRLLYAKLAYELGYYNDSLDNLNRYIGDYPSDETLGEAHLLTALSLNKLNSDLAQFCSHLETAMDLNPELYDTSSVHLQLYNAYITRSAEEENVSALTAKAAEYLFTALQDHSQEVKIENTLWLAGYYYTLASDYLDQHWSCRPSDHDSVSDRVTRAISLYSKALSSDKYVLKLIDSKSLFLEPEMLKYAHLEGANGNLDRKVVILQALIEQQNTNSEWDWQFKRQALYELATTFESLGDKEAALETYEFINEGAQYSFTPITNASAYKGAVLKFDLMNKKNQNEQNPEVLAILNQLKELQIRKNVLSEPTHLEAAIEYAKVRSALADDKLKDSRYLFFLVRMKEDFFSYDDLVGNEYHTMLQSDPKKKEMFDAYLKFVDAEILRVQSKQLFAENQRDKAISCKEQASKIVNEMQSNGVPTHYLFDQLKTSAKKIKSL